MPSPETLSQLIENKPDEYKPFSAVPAGTCLACILNPALGRRCSQGSHAVRRTGLLSFAANAARSAPVENFHHVHSWRSFWFMQPPATGGWGWHLSRSTKLFIQTWQFQSGVSREFLPQRLKPVFSMPLYRRH